MVGCLCFQTSRLVKAKERPSEKKAWEWKEKAWEKRTGWRGAFQECLDSMVSGSAFLEIEITSGFTWNNGRKLIWFCLVSRSTDHIRTDHKNNV